MADEASVLFIPVSVTLSRDMAADGANLFVRVQGTSLFFGDAALTKAREIGQLVAALRAVGLAESQIFVEDVQADVSSYTFGKSSSVTYSLRIYCPDLTLLPDVLGAITGQKNASLTRLAWNYPDAAPIQDALVLAAIERANERAAKIAAALQVRLEGVYRFAEQFHDPEKASNAPARRDEAMGMLRERRVTADDFAMELSHNKTVRLTVEIQYLISRFDNSAA